jgi:hypothetical protein
MAVTCSKKVGRLCSSPCLTSLVAVSLTVVVCRANSSSEIRSPSILILSVIEERWGEVKRPVRIPAAGRMDWEKYRRRSLYRSYWQFAPSEKSLCGFPRDSQQVSGICETKFDGQRLVAETEKILEGFFEKHRGTDFSS